MSGKTQIVVREKELFVEPTNWQYAVNKLPSRSMVSNNLEICGWFYDRSNGNYLGNACQVPGEDVYIGDAASETDIGNNVTQTHIENIEKLNMTHTKFQEWASTVYGESTAYKSPDNDELLYEMAAIAYVHLHRNKVAYGKNSELAKLFRNTQLKKRTGKMQKANWAMINAAVKGTDYSYGADAWDGAEQALYSESETSGSVQLNTSRGSISIELHMNTMGWDITTEHYNKWKENVGSGFKAPQKRTATTGRNKGQIRLYSKAVYGKTIFWETK